MSLFDPVALLVIAAVAWTGGFHRPPIGFVVTAVLVLAAVTGHSLLMMLQHDPGPNLAWLLRGTGRLGAIIVLFAVLVLTFQSKRLGDPPIFIQRALFATCILIGLTWNFFDFELTPNTLLAANNWIFYFLFLQGQEWPFSARRLSINLCIVAALSVVWLILLSKIGAIIGGLIFVSLVVSYLREERKSGILLAALGFSAISVAIVFLLLDHTDYLHRLHSVTHSVDVRLSLWSVAWDGIIETFPLGIGLEQFVTLVEQDAALYAEQHKFPHSLPLGLTLELGLLGVGLIGLISTLLWRATKGYAVYLRPVFLSILLPLVFLHDIQGSRLILLIVAYGYAKWSVSPQPVYRG
ncbi:MAG: hypothetical protein GKS00_03010 [Alphaproteobacteria bacterium]|nr:hypothetical protein [Alphaproteobacteria bacterium]